MFEAIDGRVNGRLAAVGRPDRAWSSRTNWPREGDVIVVFVDPGPRGVGIGCEVSLGRPVVC